MNTNIINDEKKRHDFVILFDVTDGNPNGDPDAGNLPRLDPETMEGLVTDVCIKRKVRNFVTIYAGEDPPSGLEIYVQEKGIALNTLHQKAYNAEKLKSTGTKQKKEDVEKAKRWMCKNFYDIRMFGAVMTTKVNCGQVRGPMQLTFARSIDPVVPLDLSITRVAVTRESDADYVEGESGETEGGKRTEMGRKPLIPYGLYKGYGFFSPNLAAQTEVTSKDLGLFWEALQKAWDLDRSASRGMMALRGLYVFTHDSRLGNAHAHDLFERIEPHLKDSIKIPRSFKDYNVLIDEEDLPEGIAFTRVVG